MTIKKTPYIVIEKFMREDLGLKGTDLLVYATIYSFSRDGNWFSGSIQRLQDWSGASPMTVRRSINNLHNSGLIEREQQAQNGTHKWVFRCVRLANSDNQDLLKMNTRLANFDTETCTKLASPYIYSNKTINNTILRQGNDEFETDKFYLVFKKISVNQNGLESDEFMQSYIHAIEKIGEGSFNPHKDLIVAWYHAQQRLAEEEGREAKFMPNARKWLNKDSVLEVQSLRKARFYSSEKIEYTYERIATGRTKVVC